MAPSLFMLYMDDLLREISEGSVTFFADYIAVIYVDETWNGVESEMNFCPNVTNVICFE